MQKKIKNRSHSSLIFWYVLFFIFSLPIFSQTPVKALESRLNQAQGEKRLKILEELVELCVEKDLQKALQYGQEVLKLIEKFPAPQRHVTLLNHLSTACSRLGDFKRAKEYAEKGLSIAREIEYKNGEADAWMNLGDVYQNHGEYTRAMEDFEKAEKLYQQTNNKKGLAAFFSQMNNLYTRFGDYDISLEFALKAHKIYEDLKDKSGLALANKNIGTIYAFLKEWEKSFQYFSKAMDLYKQLDDQWGIAAILNNMGYTYKLVGDDENGDYEKALEYLNRSQQMCQNLDFKQLNSFALINIGEVYAAKGNHPLALDYYDKSLQIAESLNDQMIITFSLFNISKSLREQGKYNEALGQMKRAMAMAAKLNLKEDMMTAAEELSDIYQSLGNPQEALIFYKKYEEIKDTIHNEKTRLKVSRLQLKYDTEKKEKEFQRLSLQQQRKLTNSFIIISILVLILAFVIYNRYRLKSRANRSLAREFEAHKQTAWKLRESEEKFRVLAEKSMVGISIIQDNEIQYANPRFLTIFGYPARDIIGKTHTELVFPKDQAMVNKKLTQSLSSVDGTGTHHYEFRGVSKDGEIIHLESYGACTRYQGRRAILETVIDITDRKQAQEELLKSQKLESIGILAGGIAHDFNNLLSIIIGNVSMAREEVPGQQPITQMLEAAEKASDKSVELANKLISLSRSGWIITEKVKLNKILEETLNYYSDLNPQHYTISIPTELKPMSADRRQLRQVLYNLMKNADESTIEPKQIIITARNIILEADNIFTLTAADYVKISITDNGKGISPEHQKNIFDPYFSTKSTFSQKGRGLSLAICYSIIKKHKGHIQIQSEVGKGTTVEIYLPVYSDSSN